jgi:hypothetical protein
LQAFVMKKTAAPGTAPRRDTGRQGPAAVRVAAAAAAGRWRPDVAGGVALLARSRPRPWFHPREHPSPQARRTHHKHFKNKLVTPTPRTGRACGLAPLRPEAAENRPIRPGWPRPGRYCRRPRAKASWWWRARRARGRTRRQQKARMMPRIRRSCAHHEKGALDCRKERQAASRTAATGPVKPGPLAATQPPLERPQPSAPKPQPPHVRPHHRQTDGG